MKYTVWIGWHGYDWRDDDAKKMVVIAPSGMSLMDVEQEIVLFNVQAKWLGSKTLIECYEEVVGTNDLYPGLVYDILRIIPGG